MPRCVFGCDFYLGNYLHRFPNPTKRMDLFNLWLSIVGDKMKEKDPIRIYKSKRVCDYHFKPEHKLSGHRLMYLTIPTLHLQGVVRTAAIDIEMEHNYVIPRMYLDKTKIKDSINTQETVPVLDGVCQNKELPLVDDVHLSASKQGVPMDSPTITTNIEVGQPVPDYEVASDSPTISADVHTDVAIEAVLSDYEGYNDCHEIITESNNSYDVINEFLVLPPRIKASLPTAEQKGNKEEIEPTPPRLRDIVCDNCSKTIVGFRYKCLICVEYNLCKNCEMQETHPNHYMIRIPKSPEFKVPEKIIHKMCDKFKPEYVISSAEEIQRGESISSDNESVKNSSNDSDVDLSEEVKSLIRNEVNRVLKDKCVKKLKTYENRTKRKTNSPVGISKRRKLREKTTTINEGQAVLEIEQNYSVSGSASSNKENNNDHDVRGNNIDNDVRGNNIDNVVRGNNIDHDVRGNNIDHDVRVNNIDHDVRGNNIDHDVRGNNIDHDVRGNNIDHDVRENKDEQTTLATVVTDATGRGAVQMMLSPDVSQLIIEMIKDGQKIVYKYVDT